MLRDTKAPLLLRNFQAILQFREIECRTWSDHNRPIIERMKTQAFREGHPSLSYVPTIQDSDTKEQPKIESVGQDIRPIAEVHVLDLAADGCIKPHVDAVRFCGPIIGGLSLGSDCVMRFARSTKPDEYVDVWLPRRSFYVMSGFSRYECTHEIFPSTDSKFKGQPIAKSRRVSLLTRCHPLS